MILDDANWTSHHLHIFYEQLRLIDQVHELRARNPAILRLLFPNVTMLEIGLSEDVTTTLNLRPYHERMPLHCEHQEAIDPQNSEPAVDEDALNEHNNGEENSLSEESETDDELDDEWQCTQQE